MYPLHRTTFRVQPKLCDNRRKQMIIYDNDKIIQDNKEATREHKLVNMVYKVMTDYFCFKCGFYNIDWHDNRI